MKTFIVGSCRVKRFRSNIKNIEIRKSIKICEHHLHNPFEIEQLLSWISGGNDGKVKNHVYDTSIYHNEIFSRSLSLPNNYYSDLEKSLNEAERVFVELSSAKRTIIEIDNINYDCNLTSISYLQKNKPEIVQNITERTVKFNEFFDSVKNIKNLICDKDLIIIPHYSWNNGESPIRSRKILREYIHDSCKILNIPIIDPDVYLNKFLNRNLTCIDSSHYTPKFEKLIAKFYVRSLSNTSTIK